MATRGKRTHAGSRLIEHAPAIFPEPLQAGADKTVALRSLIEIQVSTSPWARFIVPCPSQPEHRPFRLAFRAAEARCRKSDESIAAAAHLAAGAVAATR